MSHETQNAQIGADELERLIQARIDAMLKPATQERQAPLLSGPEWVAAAAPIAASLVATSPRGSAINYEIVVASTVRVMDELVAAYRARNKS